jgi:hypothetical protein
MYFGIRQLLHRQLQWTNSCNGSGNLLRKTAVTQGVEVPGRSIRPKDRRLLPEPPRIGKPWPEQPEDSAYTVVWLTLSLDPIDRKHAST